ncbi:MAG: MerR family transcriptional regulator [Bacilli bacterium]
MKQEFTIQEVAEITSLSVHTLRYYERIGLVDPVSRSTNGYRRYSPTDIAWVEFLNRLRATGMPIHQMQRFASLRRQGNSSIRERRTLLEGHKDEVNKRLLELEHNLEAIEEKIFHYKQLEVKNEPEK